MKHNVLQAVSALILLLFTALPTQAAEEVTYYHNDQLGSPIAATDTSGALLWEQAYDPWGYKLTSTTNERAYTGHWEDPDTGLSDYQARWYSPSIGRFTRMDPVVWDENNVRSFNRYAYANNSPYRYTDPDGNIPLDTLWDAGNVLWDVGKITVGLITSNEQLVSDGKIDLAADSLAMAVPYLPAGASKLAKLGDGVGDAAGVTKKGAKANDGIAKKHGNTNHNNAIDNRISQLKQDSGVTNIRKNQQQVDVNGNKVGTNRPDIQYDKGGCHHCVEYDHVNRNSVKHGQVIRQNDPNTKVELNRL